MGFLTGGKKSFRKKPEENGHSWPICSRRAEKQPSLTPRIVNLTSDAI